MISKVKNQGVGGFQENLVIPIDNARFFEGSSEVKGLALGALGVDVTYLSVYDRPDIALKYIASINKLNIDLDCGMIIDGDAIDAFDEAKASLMGAKYKDSFSAFDRFISTYPKSEKIADANYFLGYSQFALKNYNAAIKTYSKLKELYPSSKIIPDAIYGIANCEIQLAKIANAKKTLRELIRQYPDAEILSKAKRRLKALESINL